MITGAGGSIGSELTRQLLELEPKTLILFELSEVALYEIEMEIEENKWRRAKGPGQRRSGAKIIPVLGSVLDRKVVASTIAKFGVEVIYHAAAYKHVPIVEMNPFTGLQNNTFGTLTLAEVAKHTGVERFVLVSSDKAVRPTNVMGASKRLAELILQALAEPRVGEPRGGDTIFTMVRFGNVLDHRARWCGASAIRSGWRAGDGHPSGDHPLFHVDPRGRPARDPGRRHGERRRGVRARHGHAGEDRRSRPHHGAPVGPRSTG